MDRQYAAINTPKVLWNLFTCLIMITAQAFVNNPNKLVWKWNDILKIGKVLQGFYNFSSLDKPFWGINFTILNMDSM